MSDAPEQKSQTDAILESPSVAAINELLQLMEESEAPRDFLIWSLLATAGALLGRNTHLQHGPHIQIHGNLFVVLLGPPAVKKSSAIRAVTNLARNCSLNYGPSDTGGQRHGLMSALQGLHRSREQLFRPGYGDVTPLQVADLRPRRPSDMFIAASELGRIMGNASVEMANFFVDLYDHAEIDYQTKAGESLIRRPVVTLLGGTTPASVPTFLPDNASGHGILSRMLFVYSGSVYKKVPIPPEPNDAWYELEARLMARMEWMDSNRIQFSLHSGAKEAYRNLYTFAPELNDPRLDSYRGRRADHMLKIAMILAGLRMDTVIVQDDIELAHALLYNIEPSMHKALEFFGRNKIYHGRMLIIQYLKQTETGAATQAQLLAAAASELTNREAQEALDNMIRSGEVVQYGSTGTFMLGRIAK